MKKNVNYVDAQKFENMILESGLAYEVQKGFVKISGAKGRNVYVARTKLVGRVDLSGFEMEDSGVVPHSAGTFGAVSQEIDFSLPESEILDTFARVLETLRTLPERLIVRKPRASSPSSAVGWSKL